MKSLNDTMYYMKRTRNKPSQRAGKVCVNEWCDKPLYSLKSGFCKGCYEKDRNGTLRDPRLPKPTCDFEGCDRAKYVKGLCRSHYKMLWDGRPLRPIRARTEVPERPGQRRCRTCGQWKDREPDFYSTSSGGKQGECKTCMIKRNSINQAKRKMEHQGLLSA